MEVIKMKIKAMIGRLGLSLALVAFAGVSALAQNTQSGDPMGDRTSYEPKEGGMSSIDQHFLKEAAQGGLAEVQLGQLAIQKATNPDVKQFAQRMVNDHTQANAQLKEIARSKDLVLPRSLNAKDKTTKENLSSLSGKQFDKAYMADMVKDHTKDVAEFQKESSNSQDSALKGFASKTLPTLQDHLKEARHIEPEV
jgi:putative membrane protein